MQGMEVDPGFVSSFLVYPAARAYRYASPSSVDYRCTYTISYSKIGIYYVHLSNQVHETDIDTFKEYTHQAAMAYLDAVGILPEDDEEHACQCTCSICCPIKS